jgi:hypothetical protein
MDLDDTAKQRMALTITGTIGASAASREAS